MKSYLNTIIFFSLSIFSATNLFGQGAFVNLNGGYNLMMSSGNLPNFYSIKSTSSTDTYEQIDVSLGKGLNFGGGLGYMFNKHLGAELCFSYLIGGKSKAQDIYPGGKTDYTLSAKMFRLNPTLVVTSGFEKVNPYAKIGLIIGSGSVIEETVDYDGGDVTTFLLKMNGGIALGGNAGLGLLFKLRKNVFLFSEVNMINLSFAPKKGKITKATYNGMDVLGDLTTSEKEIEYVESFTESNSPQPDSQPSKGLKTKLPFGSAGIQLGIRFNL